MDLFEIVGTKSLDSNAVTFVEDGINFVGRTFLDNGIQGKINRRKFAPNEPNTITATVIGNYKYVKYQEKEYYCSQNINKLTPKTIIEKWNKRIAYYFITLIQKFVSLYNGQQGGYKLDDIKNYEVKVPMKNEKIDFEFMEDFVTELEEQHLFELEAQRIAELKAYLDVTGLRDYELTEEENNVLGEYDSIEFKSYNILDVFRVKNTKNILSRDIIQNSGKTPYLCASSENNSVSSYINYKEELMDEGNCVFIGGKTFVVTYQENNFYSNDSHNLSLYLKDEKYKNKYVQLYLTTCIQKSLAHKYSWGNSVSKAKIKNDNISLPIMNNKIMYDKMKIFISAIHKLVIKDVVKYADMKIETIKKVINK